MSKFRERQPAPYGVLNGSFDTGLPEGIYDVELELIPSTFNTYGPHHHRDGDRPLISPDQYSGIKNFADHPEAPSCTLISEWYLVKWGISE